MSDENWLSGLHRIFACESSDLNDLARAAGYEPEQFYYGTDTSPAAIAATRVVYDDDEDDTQPPEIIVEPPAEVKVKTANLPKSGDLAIDLGTRNLRIYGLKRGILLESLTGAPPAEIRNAKKKKTTSAHELTIQEPKRPLRNGKVYESEVLEETLRSAIKVTQQGALINPRVIFSVASGVSPVQRRELNRIMLKAGARIVGMLDKTMAAAIGLNLPVHDPVGTMIVDFGAGTTEVALLSLSGIVYCKSSEIGGDHLDEAIQQHIYRNRGLLVDLKRCEELKILHGIEHSYDKPPIIIDVQGVDRWSGNLKSAEITASEIYDALTPLIWEIVDQIRIAVEATPPELSGDLADGIHLAGGGSQLKGLAAFLRDSTGLNVNVAESPSQATILGLGRVLEHPRWANGILSKKNT